MNKKPRKPQNVTATHGQSCELNRETCRVPASVEEIVGAAAVESRPEEVEEDVLLELFKAAVARVDQVLDVFVLLVQDGELLQTGNDWAQDTRHLQM